MSSGIGRGGVGLGGVKWGGVASCRVGFGRVGAGCAVREAGGLKTAQQLHPASAWGPGWERVGGVAGRGARCGLNSGVMTCRMSEAIPGCSASPAAVAVVPDCSHTWINNQPGTG